MDLRLVEYPLYLAISIALTIWVGRALQQNGSRFLSEALKDRSVAGSVNQLVVVAFYLVALGCVALLMQVDVRLVSAADVIQSVATKVGLVLLLLGGLHLLTMFVLTKLGGRAYRSASRPTVEYERLEPVRNASSR